jgi:hypothetical protein
MPLAAELPYRHPFFAESFATPPQARDDDAVVGLKYLNGGSVRSGGSASWPCG